MKQKPKILMDVDIAIYQFASVKANEIWIEGEFFASVVHARDVLDAVVGKCEGVAEVYGAEPVFAVTDSDHNFRLDILPTYKGTRKKPLFGPVVKWVRKEIAKRPNSYFRDGLEADDIIGILATAKLPKRTPRPLIWSKDKDLKTIPGVHCCDDSTGETREVSQEDADRFLLTQVLTGDTTDGYTGLKGVGPKTAAKILEIQDWDAGFAWKSVVEAYEQRGLTKDDALVQLWCAKILRAEDYDFGKKMVKLREGL